ncbi:MAG: terpene cyclase/mutase family protein [Planctomycetia bacterium]|nr:terpene cyclase/mutase family protein [Planctomycetia bacterium]
MYLQRLTLRLGEGLGRMSDDWRARHVQYLRAAQQSDGGFAGREGGSDLYYTSFALRSLALLAELEGAVAARAAEFLKTRLAGQVAIVDFLSLIYGAFVLNLSSGLDVFARRPAGWRSGVAEALEQLRRADGGYAKTAEGQASSMYHSFLVVLCQQLLEQPTPQPQRLTDFVRSRQREDGGFVEMNVMKRSGTNPTAAAIGLLNIFSALDEETRAGTVAFLAEMQSDEGGLRANTRIPIADLLSTFTGLLTLADLGATTEIDLAAARRYVDSLQLPTGGFHGAAWDPGQDVEYTFYGLGAAALLAQRTSTQDSHG